MTIEELLPRLDGVRRCGRGWMARCPAHDDRSPSLSVREGVRGLLVHCFAGCSLEEITAALGVTVRELFYNANRDPRRRRRTRTEPRVWRYDWRRTAGSFEDRALDLALRAECVLAAAKGLDCSTWTGDDLDAALQAVGRAYEDLERARVLEGVGFSLRHRGLEGENARKRHAA